MADDGLIIPLVIDESLLKKSLGSAENIINNSFNNISNNLDKLNTKSVFSINLADFDKNIKDIETKMDALTKARAIVLTKPQTKDTERVLSEIDKRLNTLTAEKKINITLSNAVTKNIKTIEKEIASLTKQKNEILLNADTVNAKKKLNSIDNQLDSLTKTKEIKIRINKQNLATLNTSLDNIARVGVAGLVSLGVAFTGASIGVYKLATASSDADEITNKLLNTFSNLDTNNVTSAIDILTSSYGLASSSAKGLLADTGDILVGFGLAEDKALSLSLQAQKLAVDLASYQNVDVASVSRALTASFVGEREALKQYGIVVNEELIKQELLAQGKQDLVGMAKKQAEAEITLAIAMTQSSKAIGDYERTSEGLANQQRRTHEILKETAETIGSLFVPAITDLQTHINKSVLEFTHLLKTNEDLQLTLKELADTISEVGQNMIDDLIDVLPDLIKAFTWLIDNGDVIISVLAGVGTAFVALKIYVLATSTAFAAFNIATGGILLGIGALVTILSLAGLEFMKANRQVETNTDKVTENARAWKKQSEEQNKAIDALQAESKEADNLASAFSRLTKDTDAAIENQAELIEISDKLKTIYPDLEILYDKQGNIIGYNIKQYNALTEAQKINTKQAIENAINNSKLKATEFMTDASRFNKDIIKETEKLEALKNNMPKDGISGGGNVGEGFVEWGTQITTLTSKIADLTTAERTARDAYNDSAKAIKYNQDQLKEYQNIAGNIKPVETAVSTLSTKTTETTSSGDNDDKIKSIEEITKETQENLNEQLIAEKAAYKVREDLLKAKHDAEIKMGEKSVDDVENQNKEKVDLEKDYLNKSLSLVEQAAIKVESVGGDFETLSIASEISMTGEASTIVEEIGIINTALNNLSDTNEDITEEFANDWEEAIFYLSDVYDKITGEIDWTNLTKGLGLAAQEISKYVDLIAEYGGELGQSIVDYQNQITQNQLDSLTSTYDKETKIRDEKYKEDTDALDDKYEIEQDTLEEKYDAEQEAYDEQLEALDERSEEHQEKLDEINEEREELEAEKQEIMTEEDYEALQQKIEDKEAEAEKEKALLEAVEAKQKTTLDNKKINEDTYIAQKKLAEDNYEIAKDLLDDEYKNKKEEREEAYLIKKATLERKQAKANKAMQYFNASMALAQGLVSAVASGAMFGIAAIGMIPALMLAVSIPAAFQLATIKNTPLPEIPSFSDGGLVPTANDYLYPYVPKSRYANDRTLIWASEGERVLTPFDSQLYRNFEMERTKQDFDAMRYSTNNTNNNETINNYEINVTVPSTTSSARDIAKAVVRSLRGRP